MFLRSKKRPDNYRVFQFIFVILITTTVSIPWILILFNNIELVNNKLFNQKLVNLLKYPTIYVISLSTLFSIISIIAIEYKKAQRLQSKHTAPGVYYAKNALLKSISTDIILGTGSLLILLFSTENGILWSSFMLADNLVKIFGQIFSYE